MVCVAERPSQNHHRASCLDERCVAACNPGVNHIRLRGFFAGEGGSAGGGGGGERREGDEEEQAEKEEEEESGASRRRTGDTRGSPVRWAILGRHRALVGAS